MGVILVILGRAMARAHFGKVFTGISLVGLASLCRCSLLFDLSGINVADDGGGTGTPTDDGGGALDGGDGSGGMDGMIGSGGDASPIDAATDMDLGDGSDATGNDAMGAMDGSAVEGAADGASFDAATDGANFDAGGPDTGQAIDAAEAGGGMEAGPDAGTLSTGLVAFYPFDEAGGATASDASGNGHTATMQGATFAPGPTGNAASLNGTNAFVSMPAGIVSALTSFSICTWVNLTASPPHNHIWDFGTGTNAYMNLSASSTAAPPTLQFAITNAGFMAAQKINAPVLPNGTWQHVCVTLAGAAGTIFVNGAQAGAAAIALNPSSLGATTQNWIGRSQFPADPFMNGLVDNFRIYSRALALAEIQALFQQKL
jgi:hypothetical protein